MQVECTGRQTTITKALRALIDEGTERIARVIGRSASAKVILTVERNRYIAEVNVKTRASNLVALAESASSMESALREALVTAEAQAIKYKNRIRSIKRQPKQEKQLDGTPVRGRAAAVAAKPAQAKTAGNGSLRAKPAIPVTVHSFPARLPIAEPHIVRSVDAVALRPMTLEEAVKEAEFRDRDVFVFRDNEGNLKVLHRKRDGKMELIEAP
jgi:putative sigma-54 modulation protein